MPRKISREEANKIGVIPMGKKHPVRASLETMEVGEIIQITREEFKWKDQTPKRLSNEIERQTGKKFLLQHAKNKNSWVAERLK